MERLWGEVRRRSRRPTWSRSRAGRRSRAFGSSTSPATPATTSAGSTSPRATPTSATWPGCGSRRASFTLAADAAAGDRRRGVARVARPDRGAAPAAAAADPLRRRRGRRGAARAGPREPARAGASAAEAGDRERFLELARGADRRRHRPRDGAQPAPGDPARAALAGARALLAQAPRGRAGRLAALPASHGSEIPRPHPLGLTGVEGGAAATLPDANDRPESHRPHRSRRARGGRRCCSPANAVGEVIVYVNDFSTQGEFREIVRSGGGKRCDKKYREKSKVMLASVKRSPTTCSFRAAGPGRRRAAQPGRLGRRQDPEDDPEGGARQRLHRGHGARRRRRHRLLAADLPPAQALRARRGPAGGGFPAAGKSDAINKVNERNRIEVIATGAEVRGGRQRQGGREGRRLQPRSGPGPQGPLRASAARSNKKNKKTVGTFRRVAVAVPDP